MNINGTDLQTAVGFRENGAANRQIPRIHGEATRAVAIPGAIGALRTGATLGAKSMIVPGWIKATDHAALIAAIDDLATYLEGELVIQLDDYSDREWVGRLQDMSNIEEIGPAEVADSATMLLEFLLPNPTARARTDTSLSGSGALTLGNMPSPLIVTITNGATGAITEATINLRAGGAGGTIIRTLTWQGSVAVGDALVIDGETYQVTNGGVNGIDGLTEASEFPIADPREDVDYIELIITGGGGESIDTTYRKRW